MTERPRLKRLNGYWTCTGQGRTGFGMKPEGAHAQWAAMDPLRPPPLTLEQARMLAELKAWRPTQVH